MTGNRVIECCKALSGICRNSRCIHWDQHSGYIDCRDLNRLRCGQWSWCDHIQAKVRCLKQ